MGSLGRKLNMPSMPGNVDEEDDGREKRCG
jgi:hypothetical protein